MLSPRLLCLFLCFASTAHASDAVNYQRLGWISRSAAEKLPISERPLIKATCNGTWLTPIAISAKVANPEETPIEALAAWVYYNPEGESRLKGNVNITQQGRLVQAEDRKSTRLNSSH